jgi:hypothetical protein
MKLQENIYRIQSMMGIINEDNRASKILKTIDEMGLMNTIKFFGGYDNIKNLYGDVFTKENKINILQKFFNENEEYLKYGDLFQDYDKSPIPYSRDKKYIKQIDTVNKMGAGIDVYANTPLGGLEETVWVSYKDLPENIFNELFDFILMPRPWLEQT